jgi:hypothetical protein
MEAVLSLIALMMEAARTSETSVNIQLRTHPRRFWASSVSLSKCVFLCQGCPLKSYKIFCLIQYCQVGMNWILDFPSIGEMLGEVLEISMSWNCRFASKNRRIGAATSPTLVRSMWPRQWVAGDLTFRWTKSQCYSAVITAGYCKETVFTKTT